MIGIYKITNLINGKCYVGQSDNIKRRWKDHKVAAFYEKGSGYDAPLYRAIRKYGLRNFKFEVVEECLKEELNAREMFYISHFDSYENGYNQNAGGNTSPHPQKLTQEQVLQIIVLLKTTNKTSEDIAKEFNVSGATIREIHLGSIWVQPGESYPIRDTGRVKQENKCARCGVGIFRTSTHCRKCAMLLFPTCQKVKNKPQPLQLAKMIVEANFVQVGKHFGVSDNAIKKWCKLYGIPHTKEALRAWYNQQLGIVEPPKPIKQHKEKVDVRQPVKQIDLTTGEVINIFVSANAAAHACGAGGGHCIRNVCRGKGKSAYGYFWQFA